MDNSPNDLLVQTRLPQALLLDAIKNANLAKCAQLMLQFVSAPKNLPWSRSL